MPNHLTRREFLQDLGLFGAGVKLAPAAVRDGTFWSEWDNEKAPAIERPPWVRTVDKPTTEIDWERMQPFDGTYALGAAMAIYAGEDRVKQLEKLKADNLAKWLKEKKPGYTLRDVAIADAVTSYETSQALFIGPQKAKTPADRGVPAWTGTPEEASQMLTAAFRFFGAASVGFVELDPKTTRKLVYTKERNDGKKYEFADVEKPIEDKERRVIPNKARWFIVYTIQMSKENFDRAPTPLGNMTASMGYDLKWGVQRRAQEFLRGLGYMGIGEANTRTNALAIAPALGVLGGLGEMGRFNRMISPEYGPMVRVFKMITDLPLAPTKPINAGIQEFCKYCKSCAEACPSKALSFDTEPTWQVKGQWNNPGHKVWFEDSVKCHTYWQECGTGCSICFAVCPFANKDKALAHKLASLAIAAAPGLGGAYKGVYDLIYGPRDDSGRPIKSPDEWWKLDQPEYGFDTSRAKRDA